MADWDQITDRGNVEDRRGMGPVAIGGFGVLGIVVTLLANFIGGPDTARTINEVLNQLEASQSQSQNVSTGEFAGNDSYEVFATKVLGSTNKTWRDILAQTGKPYDEPRLVLFRNATQSGCGIANSQVGPHYCPADSTIYIDETFFDELKKFGASGGDVAEAYVIAHEVGHHVQNYLGIMERAQSAAAQDNQASINLELQADCFAGIWIKSVSNIFEPGEVREAIEAAAAVGDDRIQQKVEGQINPETWTHGSSAQRVEWFNRGFESGRPSECNTF